MKTILQFIFFSIISLSALSAQITLSGDNYFPVVGDTLVTITSITSVGVSITAPGGNQNWDYSNLGNGITNTRIIQPISDAPDPNAFSGANAYIAQQGGGNGFYRSNSESFAILGFEGEDPLGQGLEVLTPFTPPYVERWGSLAFFDLNNMNSSLTITVAADDIPGNIFDGLPISPDSIRVRVEIERTDLVDAWGTMTIPSGAFDVLREKRTEIRDIRLDAKVSVLPWVDVTDTAIDLLPIDALGVDTTVSYTYWSNDAKEPIVIISTDASENNINSVEYKYGDIVNDVSNSPTSNPEVRIFPNPVINQAKIQFSDMVAGDYQLDVYNLTGQSVLTKTYHLDRNKTETLNVSNLQKGMYLYLLRDEKGKRIATNRLIVAKP